MHMYSTDYIPSRFCAIDCFSFGHCKLFQEAYAALHLSFFKTLFLWKGRFAESRKNKEKNVFFMPWFTLQIHVKAAAELI